MKLSTDLYNFLLLMKKLFFRKPPLDLHGITHLEVQVLVEDYVLTNQAYLPLQIITGNSQEGRMNRKQPVAVFNEEPAGARHRVTKCLKEHSFSYQIGDDFNKGYIAVLK